MRPALKLFIILIVVIGALSFNGRRVQKPASSSPIVGISEPGLAMEFASSEGQVKDLLDGRDAKTPNEHNRQVLRWQQWIDFLFIALYWAFFFYVIGGPMRSERSAIPILGKILGILITVAALADVLEDIGILLALNPAYAGSFWPFPFGVTKWFCLYLVLLLAAAFFIFYPRLGAFPMPASKLDWLGVVIGIALAASAVAGLIWIVAVAKGAETKEDMLIRTFVPLLIGMGFLLIWFIAGALKRPATTLRAGQH